MAEGLISRGVKAGVPPQEEPQQEQQTAPQEEPQEEQQAQEGAQAPAVQQAIIAAMMIVHTPTISRQLLQMLRRAPSPQAGLAQAGLLIMKLLFDKSGGRLPPEAIAPVLAFILEEMGLLAQAAKVFKLTDEVRKQAGALVLEQIQKAPQAGQQTPGAQPEPQGAPMQPGAQQQPQMMGMMGG